MIVAQSGSDYKPVPAGSYVATCVRIIDLGTQTSNFNGQSKSQRKVLVTWEIPEVEFEDAYGDKMPALISSNYTASLHEKANLRQDLESWRGRAFTPEELKGFDLKNILGKPCMINVVHTEKDGNTYANVKAVMQLPKGVTGPGPQHDLINFDLDAYEQELFDNLGPRLKERIAGSPEYKAIMDPESVQQGKPAETFAHDDPDDEIPF